MSRGESVHGNHPRWIGAGAPRSIAVESGRPAYSLQLKGPERKGIGPMVVVPAAPPVGLTMREKWWESS